MKGNERERTIMPTYTMRRGEIEFEVERTQRRLRVTARDSVGHVAFGELANSGGVSPRIYPRIDFYFINARQRWIESACDHRYWSLDDYETGEITRPFDHGQFDLTPTEVADLQTWCNAQQPVAPVSAAQSGSAAHTIEPIFAIGGLNRGDGAEPQMPWPKIGQVCRICGQAESDGAMFTTIGGTICDDCA